MTAEKPGIHAILRDRAVMRAEREDSSRRNSDPVVVKAEPGPFLDELLGKIESHRAAPDTGRDSEIGALRLRYKKAFTRAIRTIYNEQCFVRDGEGAVTVQHEYNGKHLSHSEFEKKIGDAFWFGFGLFLKFRYRYGLNEEQKKWVQNPQKRAKDSQTGRMILYRDEQPTPHELLHKKLLGGAAKKYGIAETETAQLSPAQLSQAKEAYAVEQLRLFATEFFPLVTASMQRNLPIEDVANIASHAYGFGADVFKKMEGEPNPLDPRTISHVLKYYPSQVLVRFEVYKDVWQHLKATYCPEDEAERKRMPWMTSEERLRDLIFMYPHSVVEGLAMTKVHFDDLSQRYPYIPHDVIVRECCSSPDGFEKALSKFNTKAEALIATEPCTEQLCGNTDKPLFETYELQSVIFNMVVRRPEKLHERILNDARAQLEEALDKAKEKGVALSVGARRRLLRRLIEENPRKGSNPTQSEKKENRINRYINNEKKRFDRIKRVYGKLERTQPDITKGETEATHEDIEVIIKKAEASDSVFGLYYALFGSGINTEQHIEQGRLLVDYFVRERFGDSYRTNYNVEFFLEQQAATFMKLLSIRASANRFPSDDPKKTLLLIESLILEPETPKRHYNRAAPAMNLPPWPENVQEIVYNPDWDGGITEEE
ncbi:MAG: hypothetical protein WAX38_02425 [Minisyncoccia bacterium]